MSRVHDTRRRDRPGLRLSAVFALIAGALLVAGCKGPSEAEPEKGSDAKGAVAELEFEGNEGLRAFVCAA